MHKQIKNYYMHKQIKEIKACHKIFFYFLFLYYVVDLRYFKL